MEYFAPKTLSETLSLLRRQKGKGKLIAGGTNVIPDLRARAVCPEVLIDISRLKKKRIRIGNLKYCLRIQNIKGYAKLCHFFL
jgi:CO/xanthine dehydrogenase FAD-binding subunit